MSLRKSLTITPAKLEANRKNAQKSTGPNTLAGKRQVSLNSFRHGLYATADTQTREEMIQIGDDPDLLARLEEAFTRAWRPADAMQEALVADLARLYWKKARLENTVTATRLGERRSFLAAIEGRRLAQEHQQCNFNMDYKYPGGYRDPDALERHFFIDACLNLLEQLRQRADRCEWDGDLNAIFTPLYNQYPTPKGERIIRLFKRFAHAPHQAVSDKPAHDELKRLISEEIECVTRHKRWLQSKGELELTAGLGSDWIPTTANWGAVLEQDSQLDRQIDNKVKLLIRLRALHSPSSSGSPDEDPSGSPDQDPAGSPDQDPGSQALEDSIGQESIQVDRAESDETAEQSPPNPRQAENTDSESPRESENEEQSHNVV